MVQQNRPQMTVYVHSWNAGRQITDIHLEYVILNAFPRQQWLCTCTSLLR